MTFTHMKRTLIFLIFVILKVLWRKKLFQQWTSLFPAIAVLLDEPPGKDANSTLAVVLLKFIRNTGINNSPEYEADMVHQLTKYSRHFPAVAAVLDEPLRELPPDRDDKVRVCALPECNLDGKGLFNKMMKCGRCRSVYYCGLWHQKEHWKVHKQSCC